MKVPYEGDIWLTSLSQWLLISLLDLSTIRESLSIPSPSFRRDTSQLPKYLHSLSSVTGAMCARWLGAAFLRHLTASSDARSVHFDHSHSSPKNLSCSPTCSSLLFLSAQLTRLLYFSTTHITRPPTQLYCRPELNSVKMNSLRSKGKQCISSIPRCLASTSCLNARILAPTLC